MSKIPINHTVRRATSVAYASAAAFFVLLMLFHFVDVKMQQTRTEVQRDWAYNVAMGSRFFLLALALIICACNALVAVCLKRRGKLLRAKAKVIYIMPTACRSYLPRSRRPVPRRYHRTGRSLA